MSNRLSTPLNTQLFHVLIATITTVCMASAAHAGDKQFADVVLRNGQTFVQAEEKSAGEKGDFEYNSICLFAAELFNENPETSITILNKYAQKGGGACMQALVKGYADSLWYKDNKSEQSKQNETEQKSIKNWILYQKSIEPSLINVYATVLTTKGREFLDQRMRESALYRFRLYASKTSPFYNESEANKVLESVLLYPGFTVSDFEHISKYASILEERYKKGIGYTPDQQKSEQYRLLSKEYSDKAELILKKEADEKLAAQQKTYSPPAQTYTAPASTYEEPEPVDDELAVGLGAMAGILASAVIASKTGGTYVPPSTYTSGSSRTPGGGIDTATPYDNSRYSENNSSANNTSQRSGQGSNQNSGSSNSESTDFSKGHPEMNASHCLKFRQNTDGVTTIKGWTEIVNTCNREVQFIFCGIPLNNDSVGDIGLCPGTPGRPYASFGGSMLSPGEAQGIANGQHRMRFFSAGCFWKDDKGKAYVPSGAELAGDRIKFKCTRW